MERTNFPNCLGEIDEKRILICKTNGYKTLFFNYKSFFSVVLLTIIEADYCFITIDVDTYEASKDSNIFKQPNIYKKLQTNSLNIPNGCKLPKGEENGKSMLYLFVVDEPFAI